MSDETPARDRRPPRPFSVRLLDVPNDIEADRLIELALVSRLVLDAATVGAKIDTPLHVLALMAVDLMSEAIDERRLTLFDAESLLADVFETARRGLASKYRPG